jgi:hypothetical protein
MPPTGRRARHNADDSAFGQHAHELGGPQFRYGYCETDLVKLAMLCAGRCEEVATIPDGKRPVSRDPPLQTALAAGTSSATVTASESTFRRREAKLWRRPILDRLQRL